LLMVDGWWLVVVGCWLMVDGWLMPDQLGGSVFKLLPTTKNSSNRSPISL